MSRRDEREREGGSSALRPEAWAVSKVKLGIQPVTSFQRNYAASCDGRPFGMRTRDSNQGGLCHAHICSIICSTCLRPLAEISATHVHTRMQLQDCGCACLALCLASMLGRLGESEARSKMNESTGLTTYYAIYTSDPNFSQTRKTRHRQSRVIALF